MIEKRSLINVDFDGTLTKDESGYDMPEPMPDYEHIDIIRRLYVKGFIIVIHTARRWDHANEMVAWLIKYKVPYHGVFMFKGGSDAYLDDKSTSFEELELLLL